MHNVLATPSSSMPLHMPACMMHPVEGREWWMSRRTPALTFSSS